MTIGDLIEHLRQRIKRIDHFTLRIHQRKVLPAAVKRKIRVRSTDEEPCLILSRCIDQEILARFDLLITRKAPLFEIVLVVRHRIASQRE